MMLIFSAVLLFTMQKFVDWLYYFVTIDPKLTTPAVQTAAITALSAGAGVLFICFSAVQIWFITGSVRSVEAMFKFNATTAAQTALSAAAQVTEIKQEFDTPELHARYDDK